MWIPDPRFEEPNLLRPNTSPIGTVAIDRSHPLAKGLIRFWLPRMGEVYSRNEGGMSLKDLASGDDAFCVESLTSREVKVNMNNGAPALVAEDTDTFANQMQPTQGVDFSADDAWTIISRRGEMPDGVSDELRFYVYGANTVGIWNRQGTYFRFRGSDQTTDLTASSVLVTGDLTHGMSASGGGAGNSSLLAYQHETNEFSTATGRTTTLEVAELSQISTIGIKFTAVWDRALGRAEFQSFCRNPYQILIPV